LFFVKLGVFLNNNLKIGVFAYNWPHYKTQTGLLNMYLNSIKPDIVFAADPVELKFYKSKKRTCVKSIRLHDTQKICQSLDIDFVNVEHNSEECEKYIRKRDLDLGIILGARIIKNNIINSFKIGIINMHPGILPENRGLDNLKWAIIKQMPQGVTTHLIDSKIDLGHMIDCQHIVIDKDDTIFDIQLKLQNKEQDMLLEAIQVISNKNYTKKIKKIDKGSYHKSVPAEIEKDLEIYFKKYIEKFGV
jgi:phosphoribosylglycinamide formyltransferase-1